MKKNSFVPRSIIAASAQNILSSLLVLSAFLLMTRTLEGQEITDNFDLGADPGWQHYTPTTSGGALPQYSFPANGTGKGYQMFAPPCTCQGILQRGGSYRSEQYTEFFYSVDLANWDPTYGSYALFGSRIGPPGTLAPLSTQGYMNGYLIGAPRQRQGVLLNIEFTSEVISSVVDAWRGGAALTAVFPPSRPLRVAVSGTNDTFRTEIYDKTDLLEPLVRISYQDFPHCVGGAPDGTSVHLQGENLLGWLNAADLGINSTCNFTYDNYHATGARNTPIGYPGTPQVVELKPAPQTLFYSIPSTNPITFAVQTFNNNQINTNLIKLLLNDVDVSGQLVFSNRAGILDPPNANFGVRYTGTLIPNTIYHGQITALDMSGTGTTNNWYFDTVSFFNPTNVSDQSGFLLVEAEDYNYNGGSFQDYPAVSGTDETTSAEDPLVAPGCDTKPQETLGPQVNGNGVGYYNLIGTPDVDFHDNTSDRTPDVYRMRQVHQYRTNDLVGTMQGTKGGGFDTPRSYRMGLANDAGGASYVPDYVVSDMDAGDWMNYTRTFPHTNYQVYLRASSQGRQDARFDEVTGDRTQPNQSTALRGQFLVPNTESWTRWRYVPLTDGAGNPQILDLQGIKTMRLTANEVRRAITSAVDMGDLQLNWMLFVPTPAGASSGPWLASAKPSRNAANFGPAGQVELVVLDRGTAVVPGSIQLRFDGSNVTSAATITPTTSEGSGATVRYTPGVLLPKSAHNISVSFGNGSTTQSNYWNFTVDDIPVLNAAHAVGGSPDSLFTVQVHKATNDEPASCSQTVNYVTFDPQTGQAMTNSTSITIDTFEDTTARGERQVAGQLINPDTQMPFQNEVAGTNNGFYAEFNAINYEGCGNDPPNEKLKGDFASSAGFFPGIAPPTYDCTVEGNPLHFGMVATINLQLGTGHYLMGVNSDDQFKLTAGGGLGTNVFLASSETVPGTRDDGQFDFVVATNGIYKFRLLQEQQDGRALLQWYWINPTTGARDLVRPLFLESAAAVNGPYTAETTAAINPSDKTVTIARSGNARFYRLRSTTAYKISSIASKGNSILMNYQ